LSLSLPVGRLRMADTCPGVSGTRIEGHEYTSWPLSQTKGSMPVDQFEKSLNVHFFILLSIPLYELSTATFFFILFQWKKNQKLSLITSVTVTLACLELQTVCLYHTVW
jgi:hypothetical protein